MTEANPIIHVVAGSATTTGSTTTLISYVPDNSDVVIHVHWTVVGRETSSGQITTYEAIASFKNPSGSMAQSGTTTVLHEVDEDTNVTFTETGSGAAILLQVNPSPDTTQWSAWAQFTVYVTV